MRKVISIIVALAIAIGFSQCRKRPNMPLWNGGYSTRTIEFTTGFGGEEKGDFVDDAGKVLKYRWDIDDGDGVVDSLFIYAQKTEGSEFTGGTYLGAIPIVNVSEDYKASFMGDLKGVPNKGVLRFVVFGQGVEVGENGAAENIDFSTQDGTLETISKYVVAIHDERIELKGRVVIKNANLEIQFALAKFSFSNFAQNRITLKNSVNRKVIVNEQGLIEYGNPGSMTLNITDISKGNNKAEYYTVMLPKKVTNYRFTDDLMDATIGAAIESNSFYVGEDKNAIELIAIPIDGLSGLFSVSSSQKVYFSKGNLQKICSETPARWQFAENQYDCFGPDNQSTDKDLFKPSEYQLISGWRVLDNKEMEFLLDRKKDDRPLRGFGSVKLSESEHVNGLIVLPDDWDWSVDKDFNTAKPAYVDDVESLWPNTYTTEEWAIMESAGAVFLPAAGTINIKDGATVIERKNKYARYNGARVGSTDDYYVIFLACNNSETRFEINYNIAENYYTRSVSYRLVFNKPAK